MKALRFSRMALLLSVASYLLLLALGAMHLIDGWTSAVLAALAAWAIAISAALTLVAQLALRRRRRSG